MQDILNRSLSAALGAISYSLLSIWLNVINGGIGISLIIGYPAYYGSKYVYEGPFNDYVGQRTYLGFVGGVLGAVLGFCLAAISLPFLTILTAYDFIYNLIVGTMEGYKKNAESIWETVTSNWRQFLIFNRGQNEGYIFTSLISLDSWLHQPAEAEARVEDSRLSDIFIQMQNPKQFYEWIFSSLVDDREEIDLKAYDAQVQRNMHFLYIQAYLLGRYDLVRRYIQAYPTQKDTIQEALFLSCIRNHLEGNDRVFNHFLSENPEYYQRSQALLAEHKQSQNAYSKLVKMEPFLNKDLTEDEKRQAKEISTEQMKLYLEQYSKLTGELAANEDQLIPKIEFETDDEIVLFSKQYQAKSGAWLAVPNGTKKTCEGNFRRWFSQNLHHPLTNDNVIEPTPYTGRPARYIWHRYDERQGNGSQLLGQLADSMRAVIAEQAKHEDINETEMHYKKDSTI